MYAGHFLRAFTRVFLKFVQFRELVALNLHLAQFISLKKKGKNDVDAFLRSIADMLGHVLCVFSVRICDGSSAQQCHHWTR